MTHKLLAEKVADLIITRLRSGLEIDDETRHFLISCEGLSDSSSIPWFLNNREFDSSPVYELIFYPDTLTRQTIEQTIPARGLDNSEIMHLCTIIEAARGEIVLFACGEKISLPWELFKKNAVQYACRLNLEVNTDIFPVTDLCSFIEERTALRRAGFSPSGEHALFLSALADHARKSNIIDREALFSFALQMTRDSDEKILTLLENRKHFYESAIRETLEFSRIAGRYSMEFIMAKKIPVPLTGIEEASDSIRKIDTITGLVYGFIIPPLEEGLEILIKNGRLTDFE